MSEENYDDEVLKRLKRLENKIDAIEIESQQEFKNIKNTVETNERKLDENLRTIDHKIDKLEKEFKVTGEDSLFFGLLISLVILFLTLPRNDIAKFFVSLNSSTATYSATVIQFIGLVFFVISGISRYLAIMSSQKPSSQTYRYFSLEFLIVSFEFILTVFIINTFAIFSNSALFATMGFTILSFCIIGMSVIERKALIFYESRQLIPINSRMMASRIFMSVAIGIDVAFLIEYISVLIKHELSSSVLTPVSLIVVVLIFLIVSRKPKKSAKN
jgi:hypothetical protein